MSRLFVTRVWLGLVAIAAAILLIYWLGAWRGPVSGEIGLMALFAALALVAEHFPVSVGPRRKVNLSISVFFACLLRFGAPVAMVLVGVSQLAGQLTLYLRRDPGTGRRMRSARNVAFNTSQFMVATALAGVVYYSFVPQVAPAPLERVENLWAVPAAAGTMYLANSGAVAVKTALLLQQHPLTTWLSGRGTHTLEFAGLFLIGLVAALSSIHYEWAPLAMALAAAILGLWMERTVRSLERERAARVEIEAGAERIQGLQQAVEAEHATLVALMANMTDGLLVLDPARRVRYANARVSELLGVDPGVLVGLEGETEVSRVVPALRERGPRLLWQRLVNSPETVPHAEITVPGPSQRVILISAFRSPAPGGESLGLLLRDVTELQALSLLEERERIARDLHDGVIQSLYGVALALAGSGRANEQTPSPTKEAVIHPEINETLNYAVSNISGVIQEIRDYVYDLRMHELGQHGIKAGLEALIKELRINTLVEADLEVDPAAETLLSDDAATNILSIAREATSNVIRHAGATEVVIRLAREDSLVVLSVRDDGRGIGPADQGTVPSRYKTGQGLKNMHDRAKAIGGELAITSRDGCGTEVRLTLPA